jgi:hypothetical protein
MSAHLLLFNDEESKGKINIDDLYERNMNRDLKQLSVFNKILNRIHKRITTTAKNKRNDQFIWFQVPSFLFGEATYDPGDCLGYLVTKLTDNGFHVRYIHPNTLYISWENWVPSYIRTEIKKRTGKIISEKGEYLGDVGAKGAGTGNGNGSGTGNGNGNGSGNGNGTTLPSSTAATPAAKTYTPIDEYKPSGNLGVYNQDMFARIFQKAPRVDPGTNP